MFFAEETSTRRYRRLRRIFGRYLQQRLRPRWRLVTFHRLRRRQIAVLYTLAQFARWPEEVWRRCLTMRPAKSLLLVKRSERSLKRPRLIRSSLFATRRRLFVSMRKVRHS